MRLWKPIAAGIFFILVLMYSEHKRMMGSEDFQDMNSVFNLIRQLQEASGQLGKSKSYDQWVGWIYTNVDQSGPILNDLKSRAFHPTCKFKRDWPTNLPAGLQRPNPADNAENAQAAYRSYLDCLANSNDECIKLLNNARARFMQPGCRFANPSNRSVYNTKVSNDLFKEPSKPK
jgi:hypothetical protein